MAIWERHNADFDKTVFDEKTALLSPFFRTVVIFGGLCLTAMMRYKGCIRYLPVYSLTIFKSILVNMGIDTDK